MSGDLFSIIELFVNLFEATLFSIFCSSTLGMKRKWFAYLIIGICFCIITCMNWPDIGATFKLCINILLLFILQLIFCVGTIKRKLIYLMFFFVTVMVSETVATLVIMSITTIDSDAITAAGKTRLAGMIISKILMFIMVIIICKAQKKNRTKIPPKYWLLLMFVPTTSIIEMAMLYSLDWIYIENTIGPYLFSIVVIGLLFSNVFVFQLFDNFANAFVLSEENQLIKQQMELQEAHLSEIQRSNQSIRSMWHDMNNHLDAIKRIKETGNVDEVDSYIEQLADKLSRSKPCCDCGIPIIDAVVSSKYERASSAGVEMKVQVNVCSLYGIPTADIGSLISNILDNAIEACERITLSTSECERSRRIIFSATEKGNFLVFNCTNAISEADSRKKQITESQKSDNRIHGIGLRSIEEIAERNNGNVLIRNDKNSFTIIVFLQAQKK